MMIRFFLLTIAYALASICLVTLRPTDMTPAPFASASQPVPQNYLPKEIPEACPVTKRPARPFVPPTPYWTEAGQDAFWYGTESLWTVLDAHGTWNIQNNVLQSEGGYRTKLTYWRKGFDWRRDKPDLVVIAKRLDRKAPIVTASTASAVFVTGPAPSAMMTMVDIPSSGCWEIEAKYHDQKLSFIVAVQP